MVQIFDHVKTTRFNLNLRIVEFKTSQKGHTKGVIIQRVGVATYDILLTDKATGNDLWRAAWRVYQGARPENIVTLHRGEFYLPPLPKAEWEPDTYLPYDYTGFVYADSLEFINPYAKVNQPNLQNMIR